MPFRQAYCFNFKSNYDSFFLQSTKMLTEFWLDTLSLKNAKHLKNISEELMPIVWYPKRPWNFCEPEDEIKKTRFSE